MYALRYNRGQQSLLSAKCEVGGGVIPYRGLHRHYKSAGLGTHTVAVPLSRATTLLKVTPIDEPHAVATDIAKIHQYSDGDWI
jgi:hypothetical protein